MAEIGVHARPLPGLPHAHARIPVWNAEGWFDEDVTIGDRIGSIRVNPAPFAGEARSRLTEKAARKGSVDG